MNDFSKLVNYLRSKDLYPDMRLVKGISTNTTGIVDGKKVLIFCSNNYLSLAGHKEIVEEIKKGAEIYGLGSGGSRMVSGNIDVHVNLENAVAKLKKTESAITFLSGYMANTGAIPAIVNLINPEDLFSIKRIFKKNKTEIFSDELNHASIIDGCKLAKVKINVFAHKDMSDLGNKLKRSKANRKLIVTDGVFSMDGDIAPLDKIYELAKKYNALTMVDDAHGTGVLGEKGEGTISHFGLGGKIDVVMGTFTKSFGGVGGFIAGSKDLIDYLRITSRSYIFSAPIAPPITMGLIKAAEIIIQDDERRDRLWRNTNYFRESLKKMNFKVFGETPIVPVFIGDERKAILIARSLYDNGIFAPAIRWPAVGKKESRIRFTIMADHTMDQIDELLKIMSSIKKEFNV